jgi:hypothetical protein
MAPEEPQYQDLSGTDPGLLPIGPNPFNPSIVLRYRVPSRSKVHLVVYDVTGRKVSELRKATLPAGVYEDRWDGRSDSGHRAASGVYFVHLAIGDFEQTRKLVIAK